MILLSNLLSFAVVSAQGERARLIDLAIIPESEYPQVEYLMINQKGRQQCGILWDSIESIDTKGRRLIINDFLAATHANEKQLEKTVWLKRDLLDAQVLDLTNRRAVRANDLVLVERGGQLFLQGADASSRAVWRRLSRGLIGHVIPEEIYDWKYVEFLSGDPKSAITVAQYNSLIQRLPAGEIARLSEDLPYLHAAELVTLLPDALATDVLEAMTPERQLQVFEELDFEQALRLLSYMAPDIAADLLGHLRPAEAKKFLEKLPARRSEMIVDLLRYPEDSVGGVMTNDIVYAPASLTIGEARLALRERLAEPDFVYFVYVVSDWESRRLLGVITLRELIVAPDSHLLEDVMNPYITTLDPLSLASDAAYQVLSSNLAALPVVGRGGQLLGVVTIDSVVAQVAPSSWANQAPKVFS